MLIPITMQVIISKPFTSTKSGEAKNYVKVQGNVLGFGLVSIVVPEGRVPDQVEGKTVKAELELYVGRDLSIRVGFKRVVGYAE